MLAKSLYVQALRELPVTDSYFASGGTDPSGGPRTSFPPGSGGWGEQGYQVTGSRCAP
ncbi:hypothetical protein GCM10018965_008370 [Nonomuraea roseola]